MLCGLGAQASRRRLVCRGRIAQDFLAVSIQRLNDLRGHEMNRRSHQIIAQQLQHLKIALDRGGPTLRRAVPGSRMHGIELRLLKDR